LDRAGPALAQTKTVRRIAAALLGIGLVASLTAAAPQLSAVTPQCTPGLHSGYVQGRHYLVYVPETAALPAPTIVSFHGRGQSAVSQLDTTGLRGLSDREGFIVVAPQANAGIWNFAGPDTRFTNRILDDLTCEDPARTYASGMSMGSAMTFLQACAQPRRFAAFGGVGFEIYLPKCGQPQPVPIIAFHGTADPIVPFAGGLTESTSTVPPAEQAMAMWARRDGCEQYVRRVFKPGVTVHEWLGCRNGVQVNFYRIRNGRHAWPRGAVPASELMWRFFQQYRLDPKTGAVAAMTGL
jgi:polyhydroxybutyrate depolymerase